MGLLDTLLGMATSGTQGNSGSNPMRFPDADAVYLSDTAEMIAYLRERGAEPVADWPAWGYVLARTRAGSTTSTEA